MSDKDDDDAARRAREAAERAEEAARRAEEAAREAEEAAAESADADDDGPGQYETNAHEEEFGGTATSPDD